MKKSSLLEIAGSVFASVPGNTCEGVTFFEKPSLGVGSPDDALFEKYREPGVIGPWYMPPKEWMPACGTVAVFFFPFTKQVRDSNRRMKDGPSREWLYGRIEGQAFLSAFLRALESELKERGIPALAPILDPRFVASTNGRGFPGVKTDGPTFGATWSDRHAAFVCGLGTFGISRNLLTERGTAGRFASILLGAGIEADERRYTDVYEYCVYCGACAARCPVGAIDMIKGKDVSACAAFLRETKEKYAPRYGCGLCQTGTPCEAGLPRKVRETIKNVNE